MLFSEIRFMVFFAVAFSVFWMLRSNTQRKLWLLVMSYGFYAAWDWRFLSLILISTVVDFFIGKALAAATTSHKRRLLVWASLIVNLGILGFFKYYGFFVDSAAAMITALGFQAHLSTLNIILPVGISFYTFQTLSYTLDIYRRQMEPTKSILDFGLFVAFFPQLVAGPIVRARDFLPQLTQSVALGSVRIRFALTLFLFGFIKKVCISDNIAPYVDAYFLEPERYDVLSAWIGVTLYSIQIYCDFSGYSDMAIACAALLGYRLTVNFLFPYFAHSLQEFWRRWHISLSTWLRDYLYISLGGNRISARVTYVNLMMTMILGGLWHGAAWTFVVWGAIHGVGLALERGLTGIADRISIQCPMIIKVALVFFLVNIAWIFFRAPDLESAVTIVTAYALWSSSGALALDPTLVLIPVVLAAAHYISYRDWAFTRLASLRPATFSLIYAMSWALIVALVPNGNRPFIYFQF